MKAIYRFTINKYVVLGGILRVGSRYIIDPWAMPEEEYNDLIDAVKEDYELSLCEAGVVLTPKIKVKNSM